MPLVSCPSCSAQISSKAEVCPKCGAVPHQRNPAVTCEECLTEVPLEHIGPCPVCGNPELFPVVTVENDTAQRSNRASKDQQAADTSPTESHPSGSRHSRQGLAHRASIQSEPIRQEQDTRTFAKGSLGENDHEDGQQSVEEDVKADGPAWKEFKGKVEKEEQKRSDRQYREDYIRSKGYLVGVYARCPKCWHDGPIGEKKKRLRALLRRVARISGWIFILSFHLLVLGSRFPYMHPAFASLPVRFLSGVAGYSMFAWISARFLLLIPETSFEDRRHFCPECNFEGEKFAKLF